MWDEELIPAYDDPLDLDTQLLTITNVTERYRLTWDAESNECYRLPLPDSYPRRVSDIIVNQFEKNLQYRGMMGVPWDYTQEQYHRADDEDVEIYYTLLSHEIKYTAVYRGNTTYVYEYYNGFQEIENPQERQFRSFHCNNYTVRDTEFFY